MLGIATKTLDSRIKDEQKAQRDYKKAISAARRSKDRKSAKALKHILSEEQEHESMLKSLK